MLINIFYKSRKIIVRMEEWNRHFLVVIGRIILPSKKKIKRVGKLLRLVCIKTVNTKIK